MAIDNVYPVWFNPSGLYPFYYQKPKKIFPKGTVLERIDLYPDSFVELKGGRYKVIRDGWGDDWDCALEIKSEESMVNPDYKVEMEGFNTAKEEWLKMKEEWPV